MLSSLYYTTKSLWICMYICVYMYAHLYIAFPCRCLAQIGRRQLGQGGRGLFRRVDFLRLLRLWHVSGESGELRVTDPQFPMGCHPSSTPRLFIHFNKSETCSSALMMPSAQQFGYPLSRPLVQVGRCVSNPLPVPFVIGAL